MIDFLTSVWGLAYLAVGAVVGVFAARAVYYAVYFNNVSGTDEEEAVQRDLMFFIVARTFIFAGIFWPVTVVVHTVNRVRAGRIDYTADHD